LRPSEPFGGQPLNFRFAPIPDMSDDALKRPELGGRERLLSGADLQKRTFIQLAAIK
jgi:hypothetical protein